MEREAIKINHRINFFFGKSQISITFIFIITSYGPGCQCYVFSACIDYSVGRIIESYVGEVFGVRIG